MSAERPQHIAFDCPACSREIRVGASRAGAQGACPGCGESVTVPNGPSAGEVLPGGAFDPTKMSHIPLRVPLYAEKIARRQRRLQQYLTRQEARIFVLKQFHEHVLQVGTLVLICLIALTALSVLTDGLTGAIKALAEQLAWILPVSALVYGAGRVLLVPRAPRLN